MRDVRIIDGHVVTLPDDPACWQAFARVDTCLRQMNRLRYDGTHTARCQQAMRRAVLGAHSREPIATVIESGPRVGLAPWFVAQLLGFTAAYWGGDTNSLASPSRSVTESL